MTKLEITKSAVKLIVASGTATIVRTIVKNNVQPDDITAKVTVTASSVVLGMMVADAASQYTGARIDEIADWYKTNVKK